MLEIFKRNLFFNSLLLLPYVVVVRILTIIYPRAYKLNPEDGYLNHLLFSLLEDHALIQSIIAIVLVFFQATFVNFIVNRNRIARVPNLLPGLVYVLLISILPDFQILSPVLIATTFLLVALNSCFNSSKKQTAAGSIFNVSFFISVATMFYFPFCVFLVAAYISLLTIRTFRGLERMQFLIGAILPLFLFATYFNWYDVLPQYLPQYFINNIGLFDWRNGISQYEIIVLVCFIGLVLFSFIRYGELRKKKNVLAQKKIDILYWFLLLTIPTLFLWNNIGLEHLIILVPSLSILVGMFLLNLKNPIVAELIHVAGLLALFIPQITQIQF